MCALGSSPGLGLGRAPGPALCLWPWLLPRIRPLPWLHPRLGFAPFIPLRLLWPGVALPMKPPDCPCLTALCRVRTEEGQQPSPLPGASRRTPHAVAGGGGRKRVGAVHELMGPLCALVCRDTVQATTRPSTRGELLLKRRMRMYTRGYQPAYSFSLQRRSRVVCTGAGGGGGFVPCMTGAQRKPRARCLQGTSRTTLPLSNSNVRRSGVPRRGGNDARCKRWALQYLPNA